MPRPHRAARAAGLGFLTVCACTLALASSAAAVQATGPDARRDTTRGFTTADVEFMSGMISHHAQAVLIAGWAPSHEASASLRGLCERIVVAQNDEIATMQRWLKEHGQPVPAPDPRGHVMPGMDHPMLMPGMLTPAQLTQLDGARGPQFDRLFLTFMIQHHQGALTMIEQLLRAPGAAQDGPVFRMVADINADQTTEINRMQLMLDALGGSPE